MRLMIGNSRSAAIPWTYCGVTAVSSMTTPAALTDARPLAAASRARTATSSRSPKRPALIASPPWRWRVPAVGATSLADIGFADIQRLEEAGGSTPADIIQRLFATKNGLH